MPEISNPHDLFFKELLSRPEGQRDFVANYLPAAVVAQLDLSSLEPTKDSFVDPKLQAHYSDLVFRVRLRSGRPAFLYLLFEHKSRPDRFAPLRPLGLRREELRGEAMLRAGLLALKHVFAPDVGRHRPAEPGEPDSGRGRSQGPGAER